MTTMEHIIQLNDIIATIRATRRGVSDDVTIFHFQEKVNQLTDQLTGELMVR